MEEKGSGGEAIGVIGVRGEPSVVRAAEERSLPPPFGALPSISSTVSQTESRRETQKRAEKRARRATEPSFLFYPPPPLSILPRPRNGAEGARIRLFLFSPFLFSRRPVSFPLSPSPLARLAAPRYLPRLSSDFSHYVPRSRPIVSAPSASSGATRRRETFLLPSRCLSPLPPAPTCHRSPGRARAPGSPGPSSSAPAGDVAPSPRASRPLASARRRVSSRGNAAPPARAARPAVLGDAVQRGRGAGGGQVRARPLHARARRALPPLDGASPGNRGRGGEGRARRSKTSERAARACKRGAGRGGGGRRGGGRARVAGRVRRRLPDTLFAPPLAALPLPYLPSVPPSRAPSNRPCCKS